MGEVQEKVMSDEQPKVWESVVLLAFCLIIALASLGVIVWVLATGVLLTLDGLLLTTICLVFALFFGANVAWSFRDGEAQSIVKSLLKNSKDHKE